MTPWTALYAPRGTPKEIVDKLNAEVMKVLAEKESRDKLLSLGFEPAGGTPDQLAAFEKTEREQVGRPDQGGGVEGRLISCAGARHSSGASWSSDRELSSAHERAAGPRSAEHEKSATEWRAPSGRLRSHRTGRGP